MNRLCFVINKELDIKPLVSIFTRRMPTAYPIDLSNFLLVFLALITFITFCNFFIRILQTATATY